MRVTALVASARIKGNSTDFAQFILERMEEKATLEKETINLYSYSITPCHCGYECLWRFNPEKGEDEECPISDDFRIIWNKTHETDILLLIVPTYGGLPHSSFISFVQRSQPFFTLPTPRDSVVSSVVLASPHWSQGAELTPFIASDYIKHLNRRVAAFEVINTAGFETENLFGSLVREEEIQRRLAFIAERTISVFGLEVE